MKNQVVINRKLKSDKFILYSILKKASKYVCVGFSNR